MEVLTVYDNYNKYFEYCGKTYTSKTEVKISENYICTHLYKENKIWPYAWYSNSIIENNEKYYVFWINKTGYSQNSNEYCGHFLIPEKDIELAIEKIIYAIPINVIPLKKKKDFEVFEVMIGWIVYITVLFLSFIFVQWYLIWFWGSIYFFIWRSKKLWE